MKWDLKDRTEDAVVEYLRVTVPDSMSVYGSHEDPKKLKYPCAVVFAGAMAPISEEAEHHIYRRIDVAVVVVTQMKLLDLLTGREQHAFYFSEVMNALAVSDLNQKLVDSNIPDVAFSGAQVDDQEPPEFEKEGRRKRTTIGLTVYAEPVEA